MDNLIKNEQGLIKTGANSYINPDFISQEGIQQAKNFASKPNVITAPALTSDIAPANIIPVPVTTTASQVLNQAGYLAELNQKTADAEAQSKAGMEEVSNLMTQIGGKTVEGLSLAESSGLNEKNKQIAQTNAEILAIRNATNQEKERLSKVPGMTQAGLQGLYNDLDTRNAFKITNLEMQNAFASINADALQKTIQTQLALKYEPLETKLKIAELNYQNNKDLFSKSEQRQFEALQTERNAQIARQKADDERKYDILNTAMTNGIQLPADIVSYANQEGVTAQQLQTKMAQRGISLENKLDKQYKQAQIAKMYQDIAESQNKIAPQNATPAQSGAQVKFLQDTTKSALQNVGASGRSALRRGIEEKYVGSTAYTQLVADTNTIKTNMLTLATDPNIKKFFGPQMSNADVLLMTSAGTTLNPELQSPEKMRLELLRIQELFKRMEKALPAGMEIQGGQVVNTGTTGNGQLIEYQGKKYNVDANGNMTPA